MWSIVCRKAPNSMNYPVLLRSLFVMLSLLPLHKVLVTLPWYSLTLQALGKVKYLNLESEIHR